MQEAARSQQFEPGTISELDEDDDDEDENEDEMSNQVEEVVDRAKDEVTDAFCHVCGGRATNYNHYGGQVCHSCRVFFRRSVLGGKAQWFKCKRGGKKCVSATSKWRSCRYCRYQRCLEVGLRSDWVWGEKRCECSSLF